MADVDEMPTRPAPAPVDPSSFPTRPAPAVVIDMRTPAPSPEAAPYRPSVPSAPAAAPVATGPQTAPSPGPHAQGLSEGARAAQSSSVPPESAPRSRRISSPFSPPPPPSFSFRLPPPEPEDEILASLEVPAPLSVRSTTIVPPPSLPMEACPLEPDVPAGFIWPPVIGRQTVATLAGKLVRRSAAPRAWAPAGARELALDNGWLLHSLPDWRWVLVEDARRSFVSTLREYVPLAPHMPEGRLWALAVEPSGTYRMWVATPPVTSLAEALDQAGALRSPSAVAEAHAMVARAAAALKRSGKPWMPRLEDVTCRDDKLVLLSTDLSRSAPTGLTEQARARLQDDASQ